MALHHFEKISLKYRGLKLVLVVIPLIIYLEFRTIGKKTGLLGTILLMRVVLQVISCGNELSPVFFKHAPICSTFPNGV